MKPPKKIHINSKIHLELYDYSHNFQFYYSIHRENDGDVMRKNLQEKLATYEQVELMMFDAIESKINESGVPDYFIFYENELAGVFEFHPLTSEDYIEIGYWLYLSFRNKGIMSTVMPFMLDFSRNYFKKM